MVDVVGPRSPTAEYSRIQTGAMEQGDGFGWRSHCGQTSLTAGGETHDVLRAAAVGHYSPESQPGESIHELTQLKSRLTRRNPGAAPGADVDDHVGHNPRFYCRRREVLRVLGIVHRLDKALVPPSQSHGPTDL